MIGLLVLVAALFWGTVSIAVGVWLGRHIKRPAARAVAVVLLIPVLFVLPLADEIVGKLQFDRLCAEAEDITVYRTVPVSTELYTPKGAWRLDIVANKRGPSALDERSELSKRINQLLRYERRTLEVSAAIPIYGREIQIFEKSSGNLLASYRSYSTPGGWASRLFEKPAIVRFQCIPPQRKGLEKRLLTFSAQSAVGGKK